MEKATQQISKELVSKQEFEDTCGDLQDQLDKFDSKAANLSNNMSSNE